MHKIALVCSYSAYYKDNKFTAANRRVEKLGRSLLKKYATIVLGWNREGLPQNQVRGYIAKINLFNVRAPYARATLVIYYPLFWTWVFFRLLIHRPEIVYSCDADTILPCYVYRLLLRKKVIFDVFDRYAMINIPERYGLLYAFVNSFENYFAGKSDALVTVGMKLLMTFTNQPKISSIILNCPEDYKATKIYRDNKTIILVYAGPLVRNRGLEMTALAIRDLNNVEFVLAGRVVEEKLKKEVLNVANVKYIGMLSSYDAMQLELNSDVMIILYDPMIPINNYAMPNKLFEAMLCGIPIITNIAQEIIKEVDCGLIVDYGDQKQLRDAITRLRDDPLLRKRLGSNGRNAFEQKYNWARMEDVLFETFDRLISES